MIKYENSFHPVNSGPLWVIDNRTDKPQLPDGTENIEQITLPVEIARQLNQLNTHQRQLTQAQEQLTSLRQQLFADWYKYMICAYPPDGAHDNYPDIDQVKWFIEQRSMTDLQAKQAEVKNYKKEVKHYVNFDKDDTKGELEQALDAFNKTDEGKKQPYRLVTKQGPRYWEANEPVVLLTGDAVKPSERHGFDGREHQEGLLVCQTFNTNSSNLKNQLSAILNQIKTYRPTDGKEKIGFSTWEEQAWHPFMLEWLVDVLPIHKCNNLSPGSRNYRPEFIQDNYRLTHSEGDCQTQSDASTRPTRLSYSGSSILMPHAKEQHLKDFSGYLTNITLESFADLVPVEKEKELNEWFGERPKSEEAKPDDWYQWCNDFFKKINTTKTFEHAVYTTIYAYKKLYGINVLSQTLSGFNAGLLMHKQTMQLPIADPLGFADYQGFTDIVRELVAGESTQAPLPLNDFSPIRTGNLIIRELRLIDTFGQTKVDLKPEDFTHSARLTAVDFHNVNGQSHTQLPLPPRIVQPARINFRWLSADYSDQEMNDHPASSPICGWLLVNRLDHSLMIYRQDGSLLGVIDQTATWRTAPGKDVVVQVDDINNPYLAKVVRRLAQTKETQAAPESEAYKEKQKFLQAFIKALDAAMESIDPESFMHHQELALLIGKPIALVRASINLEIQGLPAINQDWNVFRQDMERATRDTDAFEQVKFPISIGDTHRFNDGILGYWFEDRSEQLNPDFYSHSGSTVGNPHIMVHQADQPDHADLWQSIADQPQTLSMLIDPRGEAHARSGILPTKAIHIPPDQYTNALKNINITFLTAPILSKRNQLTLSLPDEPGYSWSWLYKDRFSWSHLSDENIIQKSAFINKFTNANAIWNLLQQPDTGWLEKIDAQHAYIVSPDQRKAKDLPEDYQAQQPAIDALLQSVRILAMDPKASFDSDTEIREGWLQLRPLT